MSIFKNPSTKLSRLWARLGENGPWTWIFSGIGVAVPFALIGWLFTDSPGRAPNPEPGIRTSGDCSPVITSRLGGVDAVVVCSELSDKAEAALIRALESKRVTLENAQKEVDKWISRYERLVDELAEINQGLDGDDPVLKQVEELVRDGRLDLAERLLGSALADEKAAVARFAVRRYARAGVRALGFDLKGALEDHEAAYRYRPDEPRYALGYADALSDLLRDAEAVEILQALLEAGGLDDATRARVYHQIGIAQLGRNWFPAATAAFGQTIALMEALRKALGERWPPKMQNDLAGAYMNRGVALESQQDYAGAVASYDAAIGLMEALRKALGERWPHGMQNDLAAAYMNRGLALAGQQDYAGAVAAYDAAIGLMEALRKALGECWPHGMQNDLALAYMNRGNALQGQQDSAEAVAAYDAAIGLMEALRKALGERWPHRMQNDLAKAYVNRGSALRDQQDYAGAVAAYKAAIGLMEALRKALGERWPHGMQNDLAAAYLNRGVALRNQQDYAGAVASYDAAIGLMEGLRTALGERWPPEMQNDLAKAYGNRGNALQGQQDSAGAVASFDAAIGLMERLRTALGERWPHGMRNDLSTSYYNRALLHGSMADLAAAAADLEQAVDLGRQVAMATGSPSAIDRFLDAAYLLLRVLERQTDASLADRAARLLGQLDALSARWPPSHWPAGLRPNLERVRTLGQRLVGDTPGAR